jgi:ABC-type nitrate/sulfonate/bicarbonate transport system substrate-binding protein
LLHLQTHAADQLKIGYFAGITAAPIFVAQEQGFFTRNGLDVETIPFTSGPAALTSLLSGSTPLGDGASALITFPQIAKGHKIRAVASFWKDNYFSLIAAPNLPTPNAGQPYPAPIKDLKGKRIGVIGLGTHTAVIVRRMLADAGLTPDDYTLIAVGGVATAIPSLSSGNIDAYLSYPPMTEAMEEKRMGYKYILTNEQFPPHLKNVFTNHLVTTQDYLDKNPKVVASACRAIKQTMEWMAKPENFNAAVAAIEARLPGNPPGVVAAGLKEILPHLAVQTGHVGQLTPDLLANVNKLVIDAGAITQPVSGYEANPC